MFLQLRFAPVGEGTTKQVPTVESGSGEMFLSRAAVFFIVWPECAEQRRVL
jgi:hypothetical protein